MLIGWRAGMLAGTETIEMISRMVATHKIPALVVDPVIYHHIPFQSHAVTLD
jgi:hydroxymethylpyrimidine/phosphomethylpyrimidine kinase